MESFILIEYFKAKPEKIYNSWLNSNDHAQIIGSTAKINPRLHGRFQIWDGYITGHNIELIPGKKIVQHWRTTEFEEHCSDSLLEILLEEIPDGTKLTLSHTNIPPELTEDLKKGWLDYYFKPMKTFFS
jgi:activator of HSP90 ATPase